MYQLMIALTFLFGLLFGSFFNVVALRIPKGESIVFPPSHCVNCKKQLKPLELVPVLSWAFLKGRCRGCNIKISPIYPFGELVTGITFVSIFIKLGLSLEFIVGIITFSFLIILMISDIRYMLVPNRIVFSGIILVFLLRIFFHSDEWWYSILGAIVCFLLLLFISVVSKGGIGGGDIKLYIIIGLLLGPWYGPLSLFFAALIGSIFGVVFRVLGRLNRKQPIPFVPFIYLGTWITYLYGDTFWQWYRMFLIS